jgi:uncharacterized protein YutE (UPF0331/DUF86 family)
MAEVLLAKLLACRDRIERIRRALPTDPEEVSRNELLEAFISFHVLLLIQDAIDLATHLIAARGLGLPSSQRDAFGILARAGLIGQDTATALGGAAALRNRIAHSYGDVDPVRVAREAPTGLRTIEKFLDEITPAVSDP